MQWWWKSNENRRRGFPGAAAERPARQAVGGLRRRWRLHRWVTNAIQWRPSPRQGPVQPYGGSSCPSHGGWPHPPMAPWPTILNELTEAHWLPTAIDPRTQPGTGAAMPVALPLSDRRTHTRHTMSWGPRLFAVGSRLWPHAQERSQSVEDGIAGAPSRLFTVVKRPPKAPSTEHSHIIGPSR